MKKLLIILGIIVIMLFGSAGYVKANGFNPPNTPSFDICDILPFLPFCEEEEEEEEDKVLLCHNDNNWHEIEVAESAVSAHLEQGDFIIDEEHPCPPEDSEDPVVCEDDGALNYGKEEECRYPEPTPENQGGGGTPPTFAGSSTQAPVCPNGDTTKVVDNGHVIRNGSEATINAFLTEGDRVHVYWRIVGQTEWQHSSAAEYPEGIKPNVDKFVTYTVKDLDPVGDYDFGILQANGCGGGTIAVIKDSYLPQVFTVTSYE